MRTNLLPTAILAVFLSSTVACGNGGNLTLEPGARRPAQQDKGMPSFVVNQGGKALLLQSGHTSTSTGVHASLTVQTVSANKVTDGSGVSAVISAKPK